jgi:hypothetical protein
MSGSSLRVKDVPEMSRASSTASSVSIQLPATSRDTEELLLLHSSSPKILDTGKSLPPLPMSGQHPSKLASSRSFVPRSRAYSSGSSVSSTTGRDPSIASVIWAPSTTTSPVTALTSQSTSYSRPRSDQQRLRAASGSWYSDSLLLALSMLSSRSAPPAGRGCR